MIVLYYLILRPLSLIPLPILYLFRFPIYLIVFKIFRYRKITIEDNLGKCFSSKSKKELHDIKTRFQKYLCVLLIESLKNISFSKNNLSKRFEFQNIELLDKLHKEKRHVVLVSSHYNNWEWLITSLGIHLKHRVYGIGMPLTNQFFNKKITSKRERFGMKVIDSKNYRNNLKKSNEPFAVLTLADQSPSTTENAFWLHFLNRKTGVICGPEYIAQSFNTSVVYLNIEQVKLGKYICRVELITTEVKTLDFGEITEKHVSILENQIRKRPENWLWSHKRWKREPPQEQSKLYKKQKEKFNLKFKK